MGARDFTATGSTDTLERPSRAGESVARGRAGSRVKPSGRSAARTTTKRPTRTGHPVKPHVPHTKPRGRLGSQQVVTVRGRRVAAPADAAKRRFSVVSSVGLPLLIVGVIIAMVLSGLATSQSFVIEKLQSQERDLKSSVETLNRDLEQRRSSAELAQNAADQGMLVASEPGIVDVAADGKANTRREFDPEKNAKVIDVNSENAPAGRASSDKKATAEISDALTATPGGSRNAGQRPSAAPAQQGQAGQSAPPAHAQIDNVAPYQPNVASNF
ncbi:MULTISPECIES: hypothetical protein [Corynebacterium]|uniref:hypothetical protein n=1 Tax=Corynebacterium TaxID=1716 RepID=UPI001EF2FA67|nr:MULTISPECIES: hypothetical protein [Corynebacterium]MCG7254467.1 hypothetical protein [Corynebacterium hadale]MCG7256218.1 hypothetical protein [Corynebacterium hadale]MCG7264990.1 hypothetical protein [Corynebacterium hadale]